MFSILVWFFTHHMTDGATASTQLASIALPFALCGRAYPRHGIRRQRLGAKCIRERAIDSRVQSTIIILCWQFSHVGRPVSWTRMHSPANDRETPHGLAQAVTALQWWSRPERFPVETAAR
jgi:hypothetical protein